MRPGRRLHPGALRRPPQTLPPYLFAEIDRLKREVAARGVDLINLGIGDPDTPTPAHIVERLREAAGRAANHRYPDYMTGARD